MINPVESPANPKAKKDAATFESVADILERELAAVIQDWLSRVEKEPDLASFRWVSRSARAISSSFCTM